MTKTEIAETVQRYLDPVRLGDIYLKVDSPAHIANGDGWWRVSVRPSRWPERMWPLYEEMAEVEIALRDKEGLKVLLYPGDPLTETEG